MWLNHLLPHQWCENTVSHHGVKVGESQKKKKGLFIVFLRFNNKWATKIDTGLDNPNLEVNPD
jgi:hypothetical protein